MLAVGPLSFPTQIVMFRDTDEEQWMQYLLPTYL